MHRRQFVCGVALSALAVPHTAEAQQAARVPRIGTLGPNAAQIPSTFWNGLRDHGWIEGKNVNIERRFSDARSERYPELATELVHLNPDVIP